MRFPPQPKASFEFRIEENQYRIRVWNRKLKPMNSGDLHKVWEIKTLKRKPRGEEALKVLERIAKQVQPIMRKHKWRVKVLSEMCPKNRSLLGLNVGAGVHVKLRLRRGNSDDDFLPFHEVLDTMLHELCHNAHGPHNASFYNLWDELRKSNKKRSWTTVCLAQ
ncbi:hypothetical protein CASFOL_040458 [Castilleja foliolosa]|uniref:WLM domain-containing protein n=1 Tax=Castilleja foliolosa TaxID=1961234 RepID=A0ABD3BBZ5_9LAMI